MDLNELRLYIRRRSKDIREYQRNESSYAYDFSLLRDSFSSDQHDLERNGVQFILAKILNKKGEFMDFQSSGFFKLLVIGSFEENFGLVEFLSETLVDFYLKTEILPSIQLHNQNHFAANVSKYSKVINQSVILYERG